jgi:hypothetical protein
VLAGHEDLRRALARQFVQGRKLGCAGRVRGAQALASGRDVPQLQVRVIGAQRPRKRVLRRVVEDQQPQPPGEPQATSLTMGERVLEEPGRSHPRRLERDHARDRQQPARVVFAFEALEPGGEQHYRQDIARRLGHRGAGPVIEGLARSPPLPGRPA